jgi:O-methyltransferase
MVLPHTFESNLLLCHEKAPDTGCIVEAGVWRGGMSAGMADMMPGRVHYLFDSFEGLPPAKDIDGEAALNWQRNVSGPLYYDNCRAEIHFAQQAMAMASAKEGHIIQGWFNELYSASCRRNQSPFCVWMEIGTNRRCNVLSASTHTSCRAVW